jgi:RNA polymerase sigma-70 factor (ECF subfamily)
LQDADARDVAQNVLFKVLRAMQTFRYDPSQKFRAWLKTITHHAWQDVVRSRRKKIQEGSPVSDDPLQTLAARDDLGEQLETAYEQELFDCAVARVRPRVQARTWEAFRLTAMEGLSGANVSALLKMPVTSVYKAKSNVVKLLEAEVRYLDGC